MSFDKLRKVITNPYTTKVEVEEESKPVKRFEAVRSISNESKISNPPEEKSILDSIQGKHLLSKYTELEREMKILREDLASLYLIILNEDLPDTMTLQEIREQYFKFRLDKRHLSNKKPIPTQGI